MTPTLGDVAVTGKVFVTGFSRFKERDDVTIPRDEDEEGTSYPYREGSRY